MVFNFATCNRQSALEFIQRVYPDKVITDTPESAGRLLDYVEKDIVRIQDPLMHGQSPQVIPAANWNESYRDEIVAACKIFHNS